LLIATLMSSVVTRVSDNPNIPVEAKPAITQAVKAAGSNVEFAGNAGGNDLPDELAAEVTRNVHEATVDGNKVAMAMTAGFIVLALGVSNLMPNIRNLETGKKAVDRPAAAH